MTLQANIEARQQHLANLCRRRNELIVSRDALPEYVYLIDEVEEYNFTIQWERKQIKQLELESSNLLTN